MARVIRFMTDKFDVSKERPNPINPIPGESLLIWLQERTQTRTSMSEPDAEDWGWYSSVNWNGRTYLIGASASEEEDEGEREWILQIDKQRTLKEKLLDREAMAADDECAAHFQALLEAEPAFKSVSVDP
ncbi:MAG: hypothetical protein ACXW2G_05490 [Burkholderiaceae bacterium]